MPERLKAHLTAVKPTFVQKCFTLNEKFEDAFNSKIYTNFCLFVPKLSPKYTIPVIMVNISNGRSSVLLRLESPLLLKQKLQKIIALLDTELFKERWERINDHSDRLCSAGYLAAFDPLYFQK